MILHKPKNKNEKRIAFNIKSKWLFEYFQGLSTHMVGYGISYNEWLSVTKGWTLSGKHYNEYIRTVIPFEEYIESDTS